MTARKTTAARSRTATAKASTVFGDFDWDSLIESDPEPVTDQLDLCFKPSLVGKHKRLSEELTELTQRGSLSNVTKAEKQKIDAQRGDLAQEIVDLEQEIRAATKTVKLASVPPPEFRAIKDRHPMRKGNTIDAAYGFNTATAFPEIIAATAIEPKRDVAFWHKMLNSILNTGQGEKLSVAAYNVNGQDVVVPFSPLASVLTSSIGSRPRPRSG